MASCIIWPITSVLRCFRGNNITQPPSSNSAAKTSVKLSQRKSIDHEFPAIGYDSDSSEQESCAVCLMELDGGEEIKVLDKCKHVFHKKCIDQWLPIRSIYCPICRKPAVDHQVKPDVRRRDYCIIAVAPSLLPYGLL